LIDSLGGLHTSGCSDHLPRASLNPRTRLRFRGPARASSCARPIQASRSTDCWLESSTRSPGHPPTGSLPEVAEDPSSSSREGGGLGSRRRREAPTAVRRRLSSFLEN